MNPVFQAGALLHEQRSHPRQLPAGNPNLGQGAGILQKGGGTSPSLPRLRFYYPDRILPVDAKEAADDEGFVVLPDGALRLAGPIGREADIADILATREGPAGAFGVFRIKIAPQSGSPAHIHRGEEEFFYRLQGEFNFKLGKRLVRAPTGSFGSLACGKVHTFQSAARCWSPARGRDARRAREVLRGKTGRGRRDAEGAFSEIQPGNRGAAARQ
jgi:quercetin dioxygenase-like cupin family protein